MRFGFGLPSSCHSAGSREPPPHPALVLVSQIKKTNTTSRERAIFKFSLAFETTSIPVFGIRHQPSSRSLLRRCRLDPHFFLRDYKQDADTHMPEHKATPTCARPPTDSAESHGLPKLAVWSAQRRGGGVGGGSVLKTAGLNKSAFQTHCCFRQARQTGSSISCTPAVANSFLSVSGFH